MDTGNGTHVYRNDFGSDTGDFTGEGTGSFSIENGRMYLDAAQEGKMVLTVWLNRELPDNIRISFRAKAVDPHLSGNINVFLAARGTDGRSAVGAVPSGSYGEYHEKCNLYIITLTGKMEGSERNRGWSRVRKDPGFNLLSEDLDTKTLHDHEYRVEVTLSGGRLTYKLDGKTVHDVTDPAPYRGGYFGFRTWNTRFWVDDLTVSGIDKE